MHTFEDRIDFEPTETTDEFLDSLMEKGFKNHRNFIAYATGTEKTDRAYRVRVNCKFGPDNSYIKMLPSMESCKKTTMVRY